MIDAVERSDGTACCARGEGKGGGRERCSVWGCDAALVVPAPLISSGMVSTCRTMPNRMETP